MEFYKSLSAGNCVLSPNISYILQEFFPGFLPLFLTDYFMVGNFPSVAILHMIKPL